MAQSDLTIEEMQENVSLWDVPLAIDENGTIPMNVNIAENDRITLRQSPERETIEEENCFY